MTDEAGNTRFGEIRNRWPRIILMLGAVLGGVAWASACGDSPTGTAPPPRPPPPPQPATLTVTPSTAHLAPGDTVRLSAEALDANGHPVAGASFAWSSSDASVATVDGAGLVTGVAAGEAEIAAVSSGLAGRAVITVEIPAPAAVSVTPDTVSFMALGDTARLSAEVLDQFGRVLLGAVVSWASADSAVASVDSAGLVTAAAAGRTTVAAIADSVSGTAAVTVMQTAGSVEVTPSSATVAPGDTVRLSAEALDANGHPVAGASFVWSSSDASAATVDGSGLVTGVAEGSATVTAAAGEARGTSEVTVANPDRAALVALYEATDGPNWVDNTNWLTDAPLGDWYGVETDASGRVLHLDLSGNRDNWPEVIPHGLSGSIPSELNNLSGLTRLDLAYNDLTGPIPPELGDLTNLRSLYLRANNLSGAIPPQLGSLANLVWLRLGSNDLSGPIPPELGGLTNLSWLVLDGNDLTGPIPPELGDLTNLGFLSLWETGVSGPIPPALGNMTNLQRLRLDWNDLTGPIPPELGKLENLIELELNQNSLTGSIPPALGNMTNLQRLRLDWNDLTGPIPTELGDLVTLTNLYLGGNNLTGEFPAFLLRLPLLQDLFLGTAFCAPADPGIRARLSGMHTDLVPCPDAGVRLLPSAMMREDGNGMSLALPEDLRTASAVTVSDPSVVAASVADGWLTLSPRSIGSADVKVRQAAGGDSAIAHVDVREAVGTFGIDILVDEPVPFGYAAAMVEAADWWSHMLDGTEWPDREAGCPNRDPFEGKVKALADELLVATRTAELDGRMAGYASGCFFPVGAGRELPALDPGGGYVVMGGFLSQGLARHEIGHLLGLVSWRSAEGLATSDCRFFTGPKAVEAFRDGGGDPDLPGVPLQTNCGSHWHEDIVYYELMGPFGGWDANSISLGALVDAGYTVDLSKALPWPRGSGAAARTVGEELGRDVMLGEPRVFIERRPRKPPR